MVQFISQLKYFTNLVKNVRYMKNAHNVDYFSFVTCLLMCAYVCHIVILLNLPWAEL